MSSSECMICLNNAETEYCSVCLSALPRLDELARYPSKIDEHVEYMRSHYEGKEIVIGLSGGVDSSYIALLCGLADLQPRIIHFDNGWNTALANRNIAQLIKRFNWTLETYVMNWDTFSSLQRSFLKASVPDIELVTDHAIFAIMIDMNRNLGKNAIVLSGNNFATEHEVSEKFTWHKTDIKNIRHINKCFEDVSLKQYPSVNLWKWIISRLGLGGLKIEAPLNKLCYRRSDAIVALEEFVDFNDYEYKHEESLFTKVYQRIILPKKFGYVKLKDHLNCLLRNNEIDKTTATKKLKDFLSYDPMDDFEFQYFLLKLSLT